MQSSDSYLLANVFLQVWLEVHHCMNFLWRISKKSLQITDKPIHVSLPGSFEDNVLVIIISEASRQLLVIHLGLVFPDAPPPGHLVRVGHLELPAVPGPGDEVLTRLVCEELQQELPQLDGPGPGEAGALLGLGQHRGRY